MKIFRIPKMLGTQKIVYPEIFLTIFFCIFCILLAFFWFFSYSLRDVSPDLINICLWIWNCHQRYKLCGQLGRSCPVGLGTSSSILRRSPMVLSWVGILNPILKPILNLILNLILNPILNWILNPNWTEYWTQYWTKYWAQFWTKYRTQH